ncbi:MAG: hypothetical protein RLZZ26_584, partial [Candidatus Parcubacteria bacterium]
MRPKRYSKFDKKRHSAPKGERAAS